MAAKRTSPETKKNRTAAGSRRAGKADAPSLSPSLCHRSLMDEIAPSERYDGGDLTTWRRRLKAKVRRLTGFDRMPRRRVALAPRTLWRRDHELGSIEKIAFTAEPGADVVAYLCLPREATPPYRCFICLQGHSTGMHNSIAVDREDETTPIEVEGDRDFGLGCLRRGLAALCIEQRSFGLRREQAQERTAAHGCQDATMRALMLGRTMIAERVFDVDRGIDYLAARGDIDMERLGAMGNSGGGTISLFGAALLPRIRLAMPSCYFCTFRASIMSIGHCVDNYVPGLFPVAEMGDVMGLFAPRPVVLVAGKDDPIFPIKAVRSEFRHLKRIYEAAGAGERCHLVVGPEGHRFYADLAWPKMLRELDRLD